MTKLEHRVINICIVHSMQTRSNDYLQTSDNIQLNQSAGLGIEEHGLLSKSLLNY